MILFSIYKSAFCYYFFVFYIAAIEIVPLKYRMPVNFILHISYAIGMMILAGIAYAVNDWRQLEIAISVPFIFFIFCWRYVLTILYSFFDFSCSYFGYRDFPTLNFCWFFYEPCPFKTFPITFLYNLLSFVALSKFCLLWSLLIHVLPIICINSLCKYLTKARCD